jgi:hypothetical protein
MLKAKNMNKNKETKMLGIKKNTTLVYALILIILAGAIGPILVTSRADAVNFTNAFVRLDRLKAVTPTGGRVCARPSVTAVETTVQVGFPTTGATDYIVNSTATNWTVTTTDLDTGQTAWPGIGTATNVTGKVVTFPSGDLTVGTLYCFNFSATNTLTTSSAGSTVTSFGFIKTRDVTPTEIENTFWGTTIVTDDQVDVTAVVAPVFSMALNGNTDTFASELSTTAVNTSNGNRTVTVNTNALNGWIVWAKSNNFKTVTDSGSNPANRHGALTSASAGGYAISNNTTNSLGTASSLFTAGAENYGLAATINADGAGGGTVSLNAAYNGTTANFAGVLDQTKYRPIASANGTANNDRLNLLIRATISNSTPPGADYTDTISYTGAGQF